MFSTPKHRLSIFTLAILVILWWVIYTPNIVDAAPPKYEQNFSSNLNDYVLSSSRFWVKSDKTLRENIKSMFYANTGGEDSAIYSVIRDMTLWVMILFLVRAWASLLLNKKPEESKKHLYSLLYIMLWWVFIYWANRLFWDVFNFWRSGDSFTLESNWLQWFTDSLIWKIFFVVLSAIKAAAFFLAIIMTVVTWFKVMAAGEWEKWKKLVKWLINVVVALLVIKWVDFIYYLAADSSHFVENASNLIINIAKVFGWLYGVITVVMVIVAWYLYITDWWTWSNFKKASNVLINILLSALVLFGFLLIVYQIFAEFQTWGDAVTDTSTALLYTAKFYV